MEHLGRIAALAAFGAQTNVVSIAAVVEGPLIVAAKPGQQFVREVSYVDVEIVGKGAVQREVDARLVHLQVSGNIQESDRMFRQVLFDLVTDGCERFAGRSHDDEFDVGTAPGPHFEVDVAEG